MIFFLNGSTVAKCNGFILCQQNLIRTAISRKLFLACFPIRAGCREVCIRFGRHLERYYALKFIHCGEGPAHTRH